MKSNIGKKDRQIRIALAALFLAIGGWHHNWISIVIGAILSITAITEFCGPYKLLGVNTCKKK